MKPTRLTFGDTTTVEIQSNGDWDLTFPDGRHVRGSAPDLAAAKAAVKNLHDNFILERWNHGKVVGRTFEVPLTKRTIR